MNVLNHQAAAVSDRAHGSRVLVEDIDLLQRETFGLKKGVRLECDSQSKDKKTNLWYTEEGENNTAEAGGSPNEEDLGLEVGIARALINQVRRGVTDTEVPQLYTAVQVSYEHTIREINRISIPSWRRQKGRYPWHEH